jgi:hypothetical protein
VPERQAVRVRQVVEHDQDQVDDVPDPTEPKRDELEDAKPRVAEVEPVDPEPARRNEIRSVVRKSLSE